MMKFKARYFDGEQGTPHSIYIELNDVFISGKLEEGPTLFRWAWKEMTLLQEAFEGKEAIFSHEENNQKRLYISFDDYPHIKKYLPLIKKQSLSNPIKLKAVLFWFAVTIGSLAVIVGALPFMMEALIKTIPRSWEKPLGEQVVEAVISDYKTCQNSKGIKALEKLYAPLSSEFKRYDVRVRIIKNKQVNAFAAPGGEIVFFHGLVKEAESPDEVYAVLVHELGHVVKRHGLESLIEYYGFSFMASVLLGGGDLGDIASAGQTVLLLSHSRASEREADDYAHHILHKTNVNPEAMSQFFERLQEKEKDLDNVSSLFAYFSTHPPLHERIEKFSSDKTKKDTYRKLLTEKEWQDLKNICLTE